MIKLNNNLSKAVVYHQRQQRAVVDRLSAKIAQRSLNLTAVSPVKDYENDNRLCLTSVHLPRHNLIRQAQALIKPLKEIEPSFFYYPDDSLHLTIKNVRVIHDPPNFDKHDIQKSKAVFARVVPRHKQFKVYFYRLLLFPNHLALIGTTEPELDKLVLDLDQVLKENGIADDKVYLNSKYFFINLTLARFRTSPSQDFREKVQELSKTLAFEPYLVDSVTLLTCNAVFKKRTIWANWRLLEKY